MAPREVLKGRMLQVARDGQYESPIKALPSGLPHVPPVPSIEHWKRDQYCPVTGGSFRKSVPTCMRYASVCRLEVFENPWKDARKFWQPDRVPKRNRYR